MPRAHLILPLLQPAMALSDESNIHPDKPLRIGLFTETFLPKVDGVVNILQLMLRYLADRRHQAILFAPAGGPTEFSGIPVIGVNGITNPYYNELKLSFPTKDTFPILKRFRPDLIHTLHPFSLGPFGMQMARKLNIPAVASFHTDVARYARFYGSGFLTDGLWAYERHIHNQATLTLCPSSILRDDLRRHGFERVRWWHRGIDTQHFSEGPVNPSVREELTDGHPEELLILNVGRHAPEKGLFDRRDYLFPTPGVRLALVGDGPSHSELRSWYDGTPTVFTGYRFGAELIAAYRSADIFLFPSTTETFGLVALEAMACRLPVIAANKGGLTDSIKHQQTGLLFDPEEPAQIRNFVELLRDDGATRRRLADAGWKHAQNQSWQRTMDQLVGFYRTAMRLHKVFPDPGAAPNN